MCTRAFLAIVVLAATTFGQESPPPQDRTALAEPELVVPAGTVLPVVLTAYLNSRSTQVGDTFYGDTTYPVWIRQRLVIPRGSIVRGTVTEVIRPGRIRGKGRMAIRFDDVLLPNGITRKLVASFRGIHGPGAEKIDRQSETVEMDSSKGADVGQVASTAGQGAVIGAIADRGTGAAIGAGAGSAVGLATVLLSRGRELVLEPGTLFDLELKQPLRFAYGEVEFTAWERDGGNRGFGTRRYNRSHDHQRARPGGFGVPRIWR